MNWSGILINKCLLIAIAYFSFGKVFIANGQYGRYRHKILNPCGLCTCVRADSIIPKKNLLWGANIGLGSIILDSSPLSENFNFPFFYNFDFIVSKYKGILVGAQMGLGIGKTKRNFDQNDIKWNSQNGAMLGMFQIHFSTRIIHYKCISIWPFLGIGSSDLDVKLKGIGEPLSSGFQKYIPYGIKIKHEITREYNGYDHGTVSVFLQYQNTIFKGFGIAGSAHLISGGVWLQGYW